MPTCSSPTDSDTNLIRSLQPILSRVRTDVSAIKKASGVFWTREPLTPARLVKHLNGGPARGVCPIKAGESVTRVALLDLDSHKGETPWAEMVAVAERIMAELKRCGLAGIPFRSSGGAGIHIYILWDDPQDAYSVRMLLVDVLSELGLENGDKGVKAGEIEVFPKQDSVPVGGFGNQFILPLAGKSEPLEPVVDCEAMGREYVLKMNWPTSQPVAVRERPERKTSTAGIYDADLNTVRSALAAIPNEGDAELGYDDWWRIMAALHTIDAGGPASRGLAEEFSARASKHNPDVLDNKIWPYLGGGAKDKQITLSTLYWMAGQHGWHPPAADPEEFAVLPVAPAQPNLVPRPLSFDKTDEGKIQRTVKNLRRALTAPHFCGWHFAFDQFRDELVWAPIGTQEWRPLKDEDYNTIEEKLEPPRFPQVKFDMLRRTVRRVCADNPTDSAITWLRSLEWDGVERIDTFAARYMGADDTPYSRAVSAYMWTALAARVYEPGTQIDMVPILVGEQGKRKTSLIRAMVPDAAEHYQSIDLNSRDADTSRLLRGCLVGEIEELKGLRSRDIESIKSFITKTHERWTPKYKEFATAFPRRCLFIGTTNEDEFLADATGERRFLPMRVTRCDVEALKRDRDRLWAEAAVRILLSGVEWQDAERLARDEHDKYKVSDSWEQSIREWLDQPHTLDEEGKAKLRWRDVPFTTRDVLCGALYFETRNIKRTDEMRASTVLKKLKLKKDENPRRHKGGRDRFWRCSNSRITQPVSTSAQPPAG